MTVAATIVAALAVLPAGARWLRVAQREHYLAGSVTRFAWRWWTVDARSAAAAGLALAGLVLAVWWPLVAVAPAVVVAAGPLGLGPRGRTAPLAFTRRLRTLAALWLFLQVVVLAVGVLAGVPAPVAAAGALAVPVLVDLACALTAPLERALAQRFVDQAATRLATVQPTIVGITGSYGKTSTKNHVAHLLGGRRAVVASPASFNNRAGLARAVNEHLAEGTEIFVAEMGTYGPGEIAELCRWCPPTVAAITAIGPVHLERFGSEDRIVEAKSEILAGAAVAVLNVDDPHLAALADRVEAVGGRRVVRCATAAGGAAPPKADVIVRVKDHQVAIEAGGAVVADAVPLGPGVHPSNLACAVAIALALDATPEELARRLPTVPGVANRLQSSTAASGVVVFDDTFNSNPRGARAALAALAAADVAGRRVLVTPGMVELGRRQPPENQAFARDALATADVLVVVGRTNRRALRQGWAAGGGAAPVMVATREQAVAWVRATLGPGDAVLYENDLPDHYP